MNNQIDTTFKEPTKPHNDLRKLQITGGTTFILSIPKEWAIKNELEAGSSMLVREEEDGALSITPATLPKREKPDEALIRTTQTINPDAIIRTAISAYLCGYSILSIRAQAGKELSTDLRNRLKDFARAYLVGTEIITDTPTELSLQVLLNYPELSVQNALSRMAIIASSMHRETITALSELNYSSAKSIIQTDREVNRFGLYIVRLLKMAVGNRRLVKDIGLGSPRECIGYRLIAKSVERTADHATKIAEGTLFLKEPVKEFTLKKIKELSGLANTMFDNSIEALFKHDFDQAEQVIEKLSLVRKVEEETILCLEEIKPQEAVNLRLIIESVRRTAEYATDISEVVLNLNVESVLG